MIRLRGWRRFQYHYWPGRTRLPKHCTPAMMSMAYDETCLATSQPHYIDKRVPLRFCRARSFSASCHGLSFHVLLFRRLTPAASWYGLYIESTPRFRQRRALSAVIGPARRIRLTARCEPRQWRDDGWQASLLIMRVRCAWAGVGTRRFRRFIGTVSEWLAGFYFLRPWFIIGQQTGDGWLLRRSHIISAFNDDAPGLYCWPHHESIRFNAVIRPTNYINLLCYGILSKGMPVLKTQQMLSWRRVEARTAMPLLSSRCQIIQQELILFYAHSDLILGPAKFTTYMEIFK